jgi:hypothetical protein
MYLKEGYFYGTGSNPADDIGQGYLTETVRADVVPEHFAILAEQDPSFLDQLKPDETLVEILATEPRAETFVMYRNDEVSFDGSTDCGYIGYGLDIAFSDELKVALVMYTGPRIPSIVRRYTCSSAEDAAFLWDSEWSEDLIFADPEDECEEAVNQIDHTLH